MKNYEDFTKELNAKIKSDDDFYYELLTTVIKNPQRYTGIFRVSNAKTKLIQNVTQSREIKFGDFMEYTITSYISGMGYINLDKNISDSLRADQLSRRDNTIYLMSLCMNIKRHSPLLCYSAPHLLPASNFPFFCR